MNLWGFSELDALFERHTKAANGVLVDTNILVSATYELDKFNEESMALLSALMERHTPLFCISNIKSEFLEVHRKILLSEALLDLEETVDKNTLPPILARMFTLYRAKYERRYKIKPEEPPLRLSDIELKKFKLEMVHIKGIRKDLWSELCEDVVGDQLLGIWEKAREELGLEFIDRRDNQMTDSVDKYDWRRIIGLMALKGLSSSDAIILNAFSRSDIEAIASSDADIGLCLKMHIHFKQGILPDEMKKIILSRRH